MVASSTRSRALDAPCSFNGSQAQALRGVQRARRAARAHAKHRLGCYTRQRAVAMHRGTVHEVGGACLPDDR